MAAFTPKNEQELSEFEEQQSEAMAARASMNANNAVSASAMQAIREGNKEAKDTAGPGGYQDRIQDVNIVDEATAAALGADTARATQNTTADAHAALLAGYKTHLAGAVALANKRAKNRSYAASVSEMDVQTLSGYPILGYTARQIGSYVGVQFHHNIYGVATKPIYEPGTFDGSLMDAVQTHANSVGGWVRQAYYAGVQAASLEVASALQL